MSSPWGAPSNGLGASSPYSAEQVEEMRRYNASLTPAGQKVRPGRGRGSAQRIVGNGNGSSFAARSTPSSTRGGGPNVCTSTFLFLTPL